MWSQIFNIYSTIGEANTGYNTADADFNAIYAFKEIANEASKLARKLNRHSSLKRKP